MAEEKKPEDKGGWTTVKPKKKRQPKQASARESKSDLREGGQLVIPLGVCKFHFTRNGCSHRRSCKMIHDGEQRARMEAAGVFVCLASDCYTLFNIKRKPDEDDLRNCRKCCHAFQRSQRRPCSDTDDDETAEQ